MSAAAKVACAFLILGLAALALDGFAAGLGLTLFGAILLATLGLEGRYKRPRAGRPLPDAVDSGECFLDPETGRKVRVFTDPRTGKRDYRLDDDAPSTS